MDAARTYERTRTRPMDAETFFNKVYDETFDDIRRYVVVKTNDAYDVEDILQNVYQSFYSRISKRGFTDIRIPEAFIVRLTQKELSRFYKRGADKKARETDFEGFDILTDADEIPFDELLMRREDLDLVWDIVKNAPLMSYKCFVLYYGYDMSVADIAAQLEMSEQNVKNRLFRARNVVRKGLKGELL